MWTLILPILKSRKFQAMVVAAAVAGASYIGLDLDSEMIMDWLGSNIDSIVGVAGAVYGLWQSWKARKSKKRAAELAADLDAIRTAAGTKAPHEA